MKQAPTFHLFPTFPRDIRLMIWDFALHPRVVQLDQQFSQKERDTEYLLSHPRQAPEKFLGFKISAPPPALLFVSHESRDIALKHYSRIFKTAPSTAEIWFDFSKDILVLDWGWWASAMYASEIIDILDGFIEAFDLEDASRVANLAIFPQRHLMDFYAGFEDWISEVLETFPKLEKLYLVSRYPDNLSTPSFHLVNLADLESDVNFAEDLEINQSRLEDYRDQGLSHGFEWGIPEIIVKAEGLKLFFLQ